MTVKTEFAIGQTVYLKTDDFQHERIVTGIMVREFGHVYQVSCGVEESAHYGFEMSATRDEMKRLSIPFLDE